MIGVDWGTSSLRAYRIGGDGQVTDRLDRPGGILTVAEGGFPAALRDAIGPWLSAGENRVLLCGMVGSRQGWVEAPYLPCHAGPAEIAAATIAVPFDGEGLALAPRTWVKDGVLVSLRVSRFGGQQRSLAPTGSYDGYDVAPGATANLLTGIKRGVLISRIWYSNLLDPQTLAITGLTRDGTFLIEDGAIAAPVKNFRLNQSVLDALSKVDALSTTRESPGQSAWRLPSIRTHDFLLASQSDAV